MLRSAAVPCVPLFLVVLAGPLPAPSTALADPLDAVPDDASWVVSFDPRPFRGTAFHDYVVPALAGDRALMAHPEALNVVRLVAAGGIADLPAWQVVAASGLFVSPPAGQAGGLLAGLGLPVGYARPLGRIRPGRSGRHAVTYVRAAPPGSPPPAPLAARADPPLLVHARQFLRPEPVLWSALRVDDLPAIASSLSPAAGTLLAPGVDPGVVRAFFAFRSRVSGAARLVLDFEDSVTAGAFAVFLADALRTMALGGTPLAGARVDAAGARVELAFRVDARLLRWLGDALAGAAPPRP